MGIIRGWYISFGEYNKIPTKSEYFFYGNNLI